MATLSRLLIVACVIIATSHTSNATLVPTAYPIVISMNEYTTDETANESETKDTTQDEKIALYWNHFNYQNISYYVSSAIYGLLSIYIFLQIHPFFADKKLSSKQKSVAVMTVSLCLSLSLFILCIAFS